MKMTMPTKVAISLLVILFSAQINAQYCGQYSTCSECMSDPTCKWCSDVDFETGQHCAESFGSDPDKEYETSFCENEISLGMVIHKFLNGSFSASLAS